MLDELGLKHGTDKASKVHNYLVMYEEFLEPYRRKLDFSLMEIGVRDGASLRVWQDYFPNAVIVGVDIMENCLIHTDTRITIEIGDQSDGRFLENLIDKHRVDVVLDDGSHIWSHQIDTFRVLFPRLQHGGVFICEDLATSRTKYVTRYGRPYTDAAASYFAKLAAQFCAEGYVYGTMPDPELKEIQKQIDWIRFGRGFVAIKKI